MKYMKILRITWDIVSCILIMGLFCVFPICLMIQCNSEAKQEKQEELKYGLSHPSIYIITYIDGSKDTISVWNNGNDREIWIHDNGGSFSDGNIIYIDYIPYKKYTKLPVISDEARIYNVLKYKKLK